MDLVEHLVQKYADLDGCVAGLQKAFEVLRDSFRQGGKVLVCGNGGSAADSEHIVGELMKGYRLLRRMPKEKRELLEKFAPEHAAYFAEHIQGALPAISLVSQTSLSTAFANDVSSDLAFAQQVYGYGKAGDVVIGISTSGSSKNVLYALEMGRALGLKTIGLTGNRPEQMMAVCDVVIAVPRERTDDVQEAHQSIYHALCGMLEEEFFG